MNRRSLFGVIPAIFAVPILSRMAAMFSRKPLDRDHVRYSKRKKEIAGSMCDSWNKMFLDDQIGDKGRRRIMTPLTHEEYQERFHA
jgi:hypothetical protein